MCNQDWGCFGVVSISLSGIASRSQQKLAVDSFPSHLSSMGHFVLFHKSRLNWLEKLNQQISFQLFWLHIGQISNLRVLTELFFLSTLQSGAELFKKVL